jgi:hydroxymethylglutaryl-CoA lyase
MIEKIKIHEVGLRDGLQNESKIIPTDQKLKWAEILSNSGIDILQLGSFVHPEKMPQMADTDILFNEFKSIPHKAFLSGLVLNEKGMERGLKCGVEMLCMGVSVSETHSKKNSGMTTDEALKRIIAMAKELINNNIKVQVSIQSAFGCGFEGKISEDKVLYIACRYIDEGISNISLADTAGNAYPEQVKRIISSIKKVERNVVITAHFHNTYGLGIANCYAALAEGAEYFETAFGGLGGCPFTKVAAGNVSTEDFIYALNKNAVRDDIDLLRIMNVSKEAQQFFGKELESYLIKL